MVFTSPVFIFLFLPLTLCGYFLIRTELRNLLLFSASLVFYAWGESGYVAIMVAAICITYCCGRLLAFADKYQLPAYRMVGLWGGIGGNLLLLGYYKYGTFIITNLNIVLEYYKMPGLEWKSVHLPIGISFFTFQAISYLVDVYRHNVAAQRNIVDCALYITLFPQLIAGPIVRYQTLASQLASRTISVPMLSSGIQRFVIGFAKKLIIANQIGEVADRIFILPPSKMTFALAWIGITCYTLQIYFDFSAYSDMAIGLGRMFGFRFLENFNYPYISQSMQEFWQRWHISLSSWFRDYVYLPLGGSRKGQATTYRNLWIVFVLCGLWHGAEWNFVVWGILHGLYLAIERTGFSKVLQTWWKPARQGYVLVLFMTSMVFFRADTLSHAWDFLTVMFGKHGVSVDIYGLFLYLDIKRVIIIILACIACMPVSQRLTDWYWTLSQKVSSRTLQRWVIIGYCGWLCLIFWLSLANMSADMYNPFIYFKF